MRLVFAYSMFVHDGEPKVMTIIGVPGITERPTSRPDVFTRETTR